MNVRKENESLMIQLEGRLDSITAPELTTYIQEESFRELAVDLSGLSYLSSAGLRALLVCKKKADSQGASMVVRHPGTAVSDVIKISGFNKILTIEEA